MGNRDRAQAQRDRDRIRRTQPDCHICGRPIDYTLRTPDPYSFEVDHVIPLSKGGRDDITNKAAAHRTCNSTKRARLTAPIVRRSGSLT